MSHNIKRGITIYSWQAQVEAKQLTWDDCIRAAVKMGCTGIELLGQLYFRYCPEILQEDLDSWNEMMWKYGAKTIAHDFFVDMTLYGHRRLTVREGVDIVRRHAEFCRRANIPIMRIGGTVPAEIFRQSVPILEDLGVKMGLEIHSGSSSFCLPAVQKVIEVIRDSGSKAIGIVPDMSMFCKAVSERTVAQGLRAGLDESWIRGLAETYTQVDNEEFRRICNDAMEKYPDDAHRSFLAELRRTEYYDPKILLEHKDYIVHCHGKFYEMTEDNEEATIDYPGILAALQEAGFDGYISAEYEGAPIDNDIFEPFRRYQKMLDKYLGVYPDANYPDWPDARPAASRGGSFIVPTQNLRPGAPFKNHYEADGSCSGVEVVVSSPYYRGIPLSLFEDARVKIDGMEFGPDKIRVAVDGEIFRFEDMCDVTLHYWNKGYDAVLILDLPGGLEVGREYEVTACVTIRAYYVREGISAVADNTAFVWPEGDRVVLES